MRALIDPRNLPAAARGAAWMLLAGACYTLTGAIVRHVAETYSVFEVAFFRSLFALALMVPLLLRVGWSSLRTTKFPLHGLRTALGYTGILCWFYGVSAIPLSDYYALQFTTPLFTIAGAVLFLGERAGARHWLAVAVGFGGALVILRPGLIGVSLGALAAVGAALFFAAVNNCVRVLSRTDGAVVIVTYTNLLMLPVSLVPFLIPESLVPSLPVWITPGWIDLGWLAGVGLFGTIAQFSITRAVAVADARVVQPFDFARLPFAAVIGYVAFGELSDFWTWIGAVIIFTAGYYVLQLERGR